MPRHGRSGQTRVRRDATVTLRVRQDYRGLNAIMPLAAQPPLRACGRRRRRRRRGGLNRRRLLRAGGGGPPTPIGPSRANGPRRIAPEDQPKGHPRQQKSLDSREYQQAGKAAGGLGLQLEGPRRRLKARTKGPVAAAVPKRPRPRGPCAAPLRPGRTGLPGGRAPGGKPSESLVSGSSIGFQAGLSGELIPRTDKRLGSPQSLASGSGTHSSPEWSQPRRLLRDGRYAKLGLGCAREPARRARAARGPTPAAPGRKWAPENMQTCGRRGRIRTWRVGASAPMTCGEGGREDTEAHRHRGGADAEGASAPRTCRADPVCVSVCV